MVLFSSMPPCPVLVLCLALLLPPADSSQDQGTDCDFTADCRNRNSRLSSTLFLVLLSYPVLRQSNFVPTQLTLPAFVILDHASGVRGVLKKSQRKRDSSANCVLTVLADNHKKTAECQETKDCAKMKKCQDKQCTCLGPDWGQQGRSGTILAAERG